MKSLCFDKLRPHLPLLLLLATTFAVYARLLGHDFQNLDDPLYVTQNGSIAGFSWPHLKAVFSSFYIGNYAPVQMLSYMLDYTLWGLNPGGFLLTNIVIHAANGVMAYLLFLRFHESRMVAAVAAGIFLLHPVQVESVAWISQRKNLLAMLFFLLSWELYCRYRETDPGSQRTAAYVLSLITFVLSLLSKSIAVILPVVLVIYDLSFPVAQRRTAWLDKLPFALAAGVIAAVTMHAQLPDVGEGGRVGEMHGGSLLATTFTMLPVFCRYLGMLLWPASLSAEYNPPVHQSLDGAVSAAFLLFMAVAWGGWRLYRYDRRLGFWVAFFFVALLPVSQIVPLFTLMNDRYLYFPILSVALFCGVGADALLNSLHMSPRLVRLLVAIPLLLLSLLSYERAGVWRNSVTLWSDAVAKVPDSSRIWGHLGNAHAAASNYRLAMDAFSRGLELDPENDQILYSSGAMYLLLGDNQQAYTLLKKLVDLLPNHIMGLVSFGDVCVKRGEYAEAEKNYLTAHNLQPDAVEPLIALGNTAVITDRLADARTYFLQAEKVDEGHPDIAYNMACVESMSGRIDSALAWLEKALQRGYGDEYDLRTNRELAMVRADIRFEQILTRYFSEH